MQIFFNLSKQEHRHDHSRKYHPTYHNQPNQEKTVVKFTQLHYSVTKQQLKSICEKYGALKFYKIHWDKMGRSKVNDFMMKETAVVGYFNQSHAEMAAKQMNHMKFEDMEIITQLVQSDRNSRRSSQENDWRSTSRNNRRYNE